MSTILPAAISRRTFSVLALAAAVAGRASAQSAKLKPGQFQWRPDASPEGPVVIIVSVPEQLVHVYRNGVEIGVSTCSTGRPGHETPRGVFTILEKQREHVSSIYQDAQMPNMERVTWGGVALHAGNLPGFPASHGCIRLPMDFSARLFEVTHVGTVVIIADKRTQPQQVVHSGMFLSAAADAEAKALQQGIAKRKAPSPWEATVSYPVVSILISGASQRAYISQDGVMQADYPIIIANPNVPLGTHVYALIGEAADRSGISWMAFGVGARSDAHVVEWHGEHTMNRISFVHPDRALAIARSLHPGTTLMITDRPAPPETRNVREDGFQILTSDTGT